MDPVSDSRLTSIEIATPVRSPDGDFWASHSHDEHELLSAITHTITVTTDAAVFVVPRGAALWIPSSTEHAVRAAPGNVMRCTWFAPGAVPDALNFTTTLTVTPLLEHVLVHLDTEHELERRARAEAFAFDLLSREAQSDAGLPQPETPWLRAVTAHLALNPADGRRMEEWAESAAVSVRTFNRRFQTETGMSFSHWRAQLRIQAAMGYLSAGASVAAVARRVGFASAEAFSAAFRRHTGTPPMRFARGGEPVWNEPLQAQIDRSA